MDEASVSNPPTKVAREPESAREARRLFRWRNSWANSSVTTVKQSAELFLSGGSTERLAT